MHVLAALRLAQVREDWVNRLDAKLNDSGFYVTATTLGDKLILTGDIFADTATRVQILETVRGIPDICAVGFRVVSIGSGVFSSSDYSLHC